MSLRIIDLADPGSDDLRLLMADVERLTQDVERLTRERNEAQERARVAEAERDALAQIAADAKARQILASFGFN